MDERTLGRRVADLEHVQAISRLKYRYWRSCDAKDPVAMRACFVGSGARIDYGPMGSYADADQLVELFTKFATRRLDDGRWAVLDMHHGSHPDIEVHDGRTASGRWTLHFRQFDLGHGIERVSVGEYEDGYRVEDGAWRIASTVFRPRWSMQRPLDGTTVTAGDE